MKLFINIKTLWQVRPASTNIVFGKKMDELPFIHNAYLSVKDGKIESFGEMNHLSKERFEHYETIDAQGKMMLPTWVDSHTHLVFADWRNTEFEDRIKGLSYQEIAARGGGILNSAQKLSTATEDQLFDDAMLRLNRLIALGTGAIEIKSGYGLSTAAELKMLRVIKRIKKASQIPVKSTFLGAHAFPRQFIGQENEYVDLIVDEMLPAIKAEGLADYIDAFCEIGYFNLEQTKRILEAGANIGLKPKVHVNQFNAFGAVEMCVNQNAISVDHLEELSDADIASLSTSSTIAVALPGCSFFLGIPYTPVHRLMDADIAVAIASDFNPGSAPDGNMNFLLSLACIKMKMTPAQAINAMTLNAAAAV
ncbi:MAG: imidazolonepropionase, partial [Salibacteraceae bacterium]